MSTLRLSPRRPPPLPRSSLGLLPRGTAPCTSSGPHLLEGPGAHGMTAASTLLPHHQALLDASAISAPIAAARGYRSVTGAAAELEALGFSDAQRRVPALLVPVWGVDRRVVAYQLRPDLTPAGRGGRRAVKYETPTGSRLSLRACPPGVNKGMLGEPARPALCHRRLPQGRQRPCLAGLCCIALLGVWGWRGTNDARSGKTALADWDADRAERARGLHRVRLGRDHEARGPGGPAPSSAAWLTRKDASVRIVTLPPGPDGAKVGLDDYLAAGALRSEELQALAAPLADGPP